MQNDCSTAGDVAVELIICRASHSARSLNLPAMVSCGANLAVRNVSCQLMPSLISFCSSLWIVSEAACKASQSTVGYLSQLTDATAYSEACKAFCIDCVLDERVLHWDPCLFSPVRPARGIACKLKRATVVQWLPILSSRLCIASSRTSKLPAVAQNSGLYRALVAQITECTGKAQAGCTYPNQMQLSAVLHLML